MSGKFIKKGTEVFLSEKGYYNYYYVSKEFFIAKKDIPILRKASDYRSSMGPEWKAIVLLPEELQEYPNRQANLVWVKEKK